MNREKHRQHLENYLSYQPEKMVTKYDEEGNEYMGWKTNVIYDAWGIDSGVTDSGLMELKEEAIRLLEELDGKEKDYRIARSDRNPRIEYFKRNLLRGNRKELDLWSMTEKQLRIFAMIVQHRCFRERIEDWMHVYYRETITSPHRWRAIQGTIKAGRYDPSNGHPISIRGQTVLFKPYPLNNLVDKVNQIQKELAKRKQEILGVPLNTIHCTCADLISGPDFDALNANQKEEMECKTQEVFSRLLKMQKRGPIEGVVSRLGVFRDAGAIVLLIDIPEREHYERLIYLRHAIYGNDYLKDLGVQKRFPYTAHLTVAYAEEVQAFDLDRAIDEIDENVKFGDKIKFEGVALFDFSSMSVFNQISEEFYF